MRHGSFFSGGGGFDLAAEWMGWENIFHCEWNPFCQQILKYYWPNAKSYSDITKTDFSIHRGRIDILTGGFPCQPFSTAGEQKGDEDERFLFPEMLRAIREIKPRWVLAENVNGIASPKFKKVYAQIYTSLEAEGYEVQAYNIPATAVGAGHERYRVWFVAHAKRTGLQGQGKFFNAVNTEENEDRKTDWPELLFRGKSLPHLFKHDDGLPGRLAGITLSRWREESNKIMGNAIVPQIALEIFKAIEQTDQVTNK